MASDYENIKTRISDVLAQIAAIGSASDQTKAGGGPNMSGAEGVDQTGYKASLYAELRELRELMQAMQGAFEVTSGAHV